MDPVRVNVSDVSLVSVFQVYTMICLHHSYSHRHSIVTVTDTVHVLSLRIVSFFSVRTSTWVYLDIEGQKELQSGNWKVRRGEDRLCEHSHSPLTCLFFFQLIYRQRNV